MASVNVLESPTNRKTSRQAWKIWRNNPFSLPSPQQSLVTWLLRRQHGYSNHFFPHWQWLSARDGLRFGPWEKRLSLIIRTTWHLTFCLQKGKKVLVRTVTSLSILSLSYTHTHTVAASTQTQTNIWLCWWAKKNIKLNWLFVWFIIHYSYWKVSHKASTLVSTQNG